MLIVTTDLPKFTDLIRIIELHRVFSRDVHKVKNGSFNYRRSISVFKLGVDMGYIIFTELVAEVSAEY